MSRSRAIKTAGDLRGFLADTLVGIRDGTIEPDRANAIAKVAAQINASVATEVHSRLAMKELQGEAAGSLVITSDLPAPLPASAKVQNYPAWCDQCDRRVSADDAAKCVSAFCKVKAE